LIGHSLRLASPQKWRGGIFIERSLSYVKHPCHPEPERWGRRTPTTVKLTSIFVHLDYRGMPVLQRNVENKCAKSGV
jgi:hypothetical protein